MCPIYQIHYSRGFTPCANYKQIDNYVAFMKYKKTASALTKMHACNYNEPKTIYYFGSKKLWSEFRVPISGYVFLPFGLVQKLCSSSG